jgi:adenylate cyclase
MGEPLESSERAPRFSEIAERMMVFGDVRFDTRSGEVHRDGSVAKLTPRAAAVLMALLERAPALLTKEDLLKRVWGGRAVSDEALTSCILELRRALDDDARNARYIETRHRRGYRLLTPLATADVSPASSDTRVPFKPSLAVLPFDSFNRDLDQEYFADGVVEDITTALSRIRSFFVVARNSSFTFKGKKVPVQEVGTRLGVRYIVEGSVQRAGKQLRITAQLIDADTGHHLWADRYDGELDDVFDLQDRLITGVVGAISPSIHAAEMDRARLKRPDNLQAYDYVLRGYRGFWSVEDPAHEEAIRLFHKALEQEPDYALAMALAARGHGQRFERSMRGDAEDNRRQAIELANAALALAPDDPTVLTAAGRALLHASFPKDLDRCEAIFRRALMLDPNSSFGWRRMGFLHVARLEPAKAISAFEQATRLSPLDPMQAYSSWGIGDAHFVAGRLQEALKFHRKCLAEKPHDTGSMRRVCALLALVGQVEEARQMSRRILAEHPHFRLKQIAKTKPFGPPVLATYLNGLRRAGFS